MTTGKDLMQQALSGQRPTPLPAMPHGWGVYKFQHAGVVHGPEDEFAGWALQGAALAEVDTHFYETFRPDLLHLSAGARKSQPADQQRGRARAELRSGVMELNSKRAIDDYVRAITPSEEDIEASGIYAHVPLLAQRCGNSALIALNEGNPVCGVFENGGPAGDFQDALIATLAHPDMLAYLIYQLYDALLGQMRVLKRAGAHAYIGSETCVSADILSPRTFRALVFPALKHFYESIEQIGLIPITYFLGDVRPLLGDISRMGVRGLMVEESKKTFELNVIELRRSLDERVALFGNVDSIYHLLRGTPEEVAAETRRQCQAAQFGPFIAACGSPLPFDTPVENIHAMMQAAREL